jgi:CheY-like chemotaxis protein
MSKTLLLADDSVVIQKLVGLSFANEDVEIITTDNGDDAVLKAREIRPDVVLADVVMPGKSGYEVCEAIKQDPALAHIPVLLLTGTFEAFDEARAAAAGANGQITKPFEAQALVARVSEVMNAPVAVASESPPPAVESSTGEYDFFDSDVTTLSAGDSNPSISAEVLPVAQTPTIETTGPADVHLFGSPGEGATDELDTQGGGLALGETVAPDSFPDISDDDATVAILPDSPPPLPPSMGDPLAGFENDHGMDELPMTPPPVPSTSVDLDSALDAVPSDPEATIVAEIDDTNAATSPNHDQGGAVVSDDEFEDLTVHTPSSAIDQDVASAPSPVAIGSIPASPSADATVVANLDVSLAEPAHETAPSAPQPLDLGPSNVSPPDLDFAFDVSEQVPAADISDSLGESFSSLMDISESQILAGPPSDPPTLPDDIASETVVDDSFAAGYDVSTSDLVTAPPTPETPETSAMEDTTDDSISIDDARRDQPESLQPDIHEDLQDDLQDDLELDFPQPTSSGEDRIADLSPLVEQRIQETLEKVAWEAFSDLSESIVKQVIGRIEQIAWEVIPQMAETLVREEIRKMKGEKD